MENTGHKDDGTLLLSEARLVWQSMHGLRDKRRRNKDFTYGNQWGDIREDDHGNRMTEREYLKRLGRDPLTNNLIRQLVKSVVGRFRDRMSGQREGLAAEDEHVAELDSRAMEEFLISGCCFQSLGRDEEGRLKVENVSPAMMLIRGGDDPLGRDIDMVGRLHDACLADVVGRLSGGSRGKAMEICRLYNTVGSDVACGDFLRSWHDGRVRVIELWKKEAMEGYECHDRRSGRWYFEPMDDAGGEESEVERRWKLKHVWRCYWLSPDGTILAKYDSPFAHGGHPFAFKLYPLTDGEVHSMVEDVIDQQKYVNRLVTLVDHVMGSSAKGVLLYPDNILPEGFSWNDLRYAWSRPNGIVPYHPHGGERPQQISTNATDIGAWEMVNLQMRLFEQISGVSGALQGQATSGVTGAQLYESQVSNSTIALSDIFESFDSFRRERDVKARAMTECGA